ncbi:MAG: FixH family protein [Pseudoxanthomonas suwonensis]|nr:FixH family protein [Pseudoxanthomonas suwonensis]
MSFKDNFRRNPALWLVIGLPLASIIAGVTLVTIATRTGGHDISPDRVDRMAQVQQTDLGPDHRAMQRNLSAIVRRQDDALYLNPVTGNFPKAPLVLQLRHPLRAAEDQRLELLPQDDGQWRADFPAGAGNDWNMVLAPEDGSWRLFGRLPRGQNAVRLAHAFDRDSSERLDAVRGGEAERELPEAPDDAADGTVPAN